MKSTDSRPSPLKGAIPLLAYQQRWVDDNSKLKIVSKGRQTGFSFAASLRAVLKCMERRLTWIFLSKGERQSKLLMEKVAEHVKAMQVAAEYSESVFHLETENIDVKQLETRFPNGSVIYGLPANPDTARGYTGYVTLDEFALHKDSGKIYEALYPTITRGFGIEVISTPNGKQGMYYDLAKKAGLVDGEQADPASMWSVHHTDIYQAAAEGLTDAVPISDSKLDPVLVTKISVAFITRGIKASGRMVRFVAELRAGVEDEDSWLQEFCSQFISTAENFFPPELIHAATAVEATAALPLELLRQEPGEFFLGVDIGRHHDRTVFWLDRVTTISSPAPDTPDKRVAVARRVETLAKVPFEQQLEHARGLMKLQKASGGPLIRRICIDATGIGAHLAENLAREFGGRAEPIVFTNLVKEDLAHRTKRLLENGQALLPDAPEIYQAFAAIKRVVLPSQAIRFDAERSESGHADQFWAKALCDLAAEASARAACGGRDDETREARRRPSVWDAAPEESEEEEAELVAPRRGMFGPRGFLQ